MRRFAAVFVTTLAVVGTAVAGFSFAGVMTGKSPSATQRPHAAQDVTNVTVHAGEYYFTISQNTAPAGTINFTVVNDGDIAHDFTIPGKGGTRLLQHGESQTWTVNLTPGQYQYICTVGEHAIHGMAGDFTVTPSTSTTTTSTTSTTTQTTTEAPPTPSATVSVSEKEFKIILPATTKKVAYYKKVNGKRVKAYRQVAVQKPVKAGLIRFSVKNVGKIPHNFVIGDQATRILASGQSGTIEVQLAQGKYTFECTITGHAALGMKGTLVVT